MKRVVIVLRRAALDTVTTAEALRVALGMTLADHQVTVLYIDGGAGAAAFLQPAAAGSAAVAESLELFGPCHVREVAEESSLTRARVAAVRPGVEVIDRAAALALVGQADAVLSF
jgi:sulfur relay (sulfurtransferase) DsrF/TusC family protein